MGPKGGKDKKSKDPKEVHIDWNKIPAHITEVGHPSFYFGTDKFKFKNGDTYEGEYCAHRCGVVWREGKGTYKTKDGHSYEGTWENDQLLNSPETIIKYPDGIIYEGKVANGKYSGLGTYIVRRNLYISSFFENNRPTGEIVLLDPNGNYWRGQVTNTEEVLLLPDNHFYSNLSYLKGRGNEIEIATRNSSKTTSVRSGEKIDPALLKELVFKKSTKTLNNFKDTLLEEKILSEDDIRKPLKKTKSSQLKAKFGSNKSLLELFWSKEYRNTCIPVPIIYPTVDMEAREAIKQQKYEAQQKIEEEKQKQYEEKQKKYKEKKKEKEQQYEETLQ